MTQPPTLRRARSGRSFSLPHTHARTHRLYPFRSSLIEEGTGNSLSGGMAARVWPFQADEGIPINCDWCALPRAGSATRHCHHRWRRWVARAAGRMQQHLLHHPLLRPNHPMLAPECS